jgi:hypothetical protein
VTIWKIEVKVMLKRYVALFAASLMLMTAVAAASNSNKWRLQFSGGADSDGTIVLRLTPKDGQAMEVAIDIEDGRSENGVAKDVVEGLKDQVSERYHVERDDGEDVLIKKRRGEENFEVEVISNSVDGVRINRDRE